MAARTNRRNSKNSSAEGFEKMAKLDIFDFPWDVKNVRRLSDAVIVFTLDLGIGLSLYNVKCVSGRDGEFIAASETKGKDGNWYRNYGIYLTEDSEDAIIDKVLETCPNK